MSKESINFKHCNDLITAFENSIENPVAGNSRIYHTGVDLGTAYVVMTVLDENYKPVAGACRRADVVRDGMVVDYIGAIRIVKTMKETIENKIGAELLYAAAAIPPGMDKLDGGAVANVCRSAGFEITALLDEATAANSLLKMENGAIVDIGGGTTGIAVIKDKKIVSTVDEATGGVHFSLVLSGAYKMKFDDADEYKRNIENHAEIITVVRPVIEKISGIIESAVYPYDIDTVVLVGGSSCLSGIEKIVEKNTGIRTLKPDNPLFVTPLGIALNCTREIIY